MEEYPPKKIISKIQEDPVVLDVKPPQEFVKEKTVTAAIPNEITNNEGNTKTEDHESFESIDTVDIPPAKQLEALGEDTAEPIIQSEYYHPLLAVMKSSSTICELD